eukprot:9964955-Ditylum_brightwellii.AAC.1
MKILVGNHGLANNAMKLLVATVPTRVLYKNKPNEDAGHRRTTSVNFGSNILSYGANQDGGGGVQVIEKNGATGVKMFGNAWKAFPIDGTVIVTKDTVLKFNFMLTHTAE